MDAFLILISAVNMYNPFHNFSFHSSLYLNFDYLAIFFTFQFFPLLVQKFLMFLQVLKVRYLLQLQQNIGFIPYIMHILNLSKFKNISMLSSFCYTTNTLEYFSFYSHLSPLSLHYCCYVF